MSTLSSFPYGECIAVCIFLLLNFAVFRHTTTRVGLMVTLVESLLAGAGVTMFKGMESGIVIFTFTLVILLGVLTVAKIHSVPSPSV